MFRRHSFSAPNSTGLRVRLSLMAVLLGLVAVGCMPWGRGTYQVEVFAEMHYSQAYKAQEPPRLSSPIGVVPFTVIGDDALHVPETLVVERTAETEALGEKLFAVNCAVCHGESGFGDGPMRDFLVKYGSLAPADVTADLTKGASDEDLFNFVSGGGRTGFALSQAGGDSPSTMPTFSKLMTPQDRWALVHYVRRLQGN